MNYSKSKALYEQASKYMSGGLNSNGRNRSPHPIYMQEAAGPYITDIDGNRYIDLLMGNGSVLLGYNNPQFAEKMAKYTQDCQGIITGFDSPLSVETAARFCKLTNNERVRFANTGTEAMMHCLRIARAYTGRSNIAVVEGAYNGWCDAVFVNSFAPLAAVGDENAPLSVPGVGGLDPRIVENTLVLPFNNIEATEKLIRQNASQLAAIVLEPVMIDIGYIEASKEYLTALRNLCDELGIILIFDELLTGFRVALGGAQAYYGIKADLAIYGKAFANGYVMSAVAGKAEILDISAPGGKTSFIGTFNGHHLGLAATAATFDLIEDGKISQSILDNTQYLVDQFALIAQEVGIEACLLGRGGHFQVYFLAEKPYNYRTAAQTNAERYKVYVQTLQENGVWCSQAPLSHHVLSAVHDQAIIDQVLIAMKKALQAAQKV